MQHRLYRAEAVSGVYAVKVLHPELLREPGRREHYARAERLARHMAQSGLPAVCALDGPEGPLLTSGEITVALFPWQDGTTLPPTPSSAETAGQIGRLLGQIHRFAPDASQSSEEAAKTHRDEEWAQLTEQAQREGAAWADASTESLPDLVRWSREAHSALQSLGAERVWTHRDLDQKNVLWSDLNTPWLLDWEGAGPLAPALEVVGTALNWAGQAAGRPLAEPFFAFVRGYRTQRPLSAEDLRSASRAVPDKWLIWLKFNMKRSPASPHKDTAECEMACGAVRHSLATLQALSREAPMREAWCEEC